MTEYAGVTDLRDYLKTLRDGLELLLIFFDATSQALSKRFNETRRKHPLSKDGRSLREAISTERELLEPLASAADLIIDTSEMSPYQQRAVVSERVDAAETNSLSIRFNPLDSKKVRPLMPISSWICACWPTHIGSPSYGPLQDKHQA